MYSGYKGSGLLGSGFKGVDVGVECSVLRR